MPRMRTAERDKKAEKILNLSTTYNTSERYCQAQDDTAFKMAQIIAEKKGSVVKLKRKAKQ